MRYVVLIILVSVLSSGSAYGSEENTRALLNRACRIFHAPKQYVRFASYLCLRDRYSQNCYKQAEEVFRACSYKGNYQKLAEEIHVNIILMLALNRAPEIIKGSLRSG